MRGRITLCAFLIAAGAARATVAAEAPVEIISPRADSVSVTIYRDLFALITEIRTVDLPESAVTLSFDGVVETLLPASVVVADTGRTLEERNYDHDELTPRHLFQRSIGSEVLLTRTMPRSGKVVQMPAVVVSANEDGVVLRSRDGLEALQCSGLPERTSFQKIPEGLMEKPRLSVQLAAGAAGKRTVRLSYLAHGFAWKSDYVARLAEQGERIDLKGWLTLRNLTNTRFEDAQVQVVAGRLNLLADYDDGTSLIGPSEEFDDERQLREAREAKLAELLEEQSGDSEYYEGQPSLFSGCLAIPLPVQAAAASLQRAAAPVMYSDALEEVIVTGARKAMAEREELADYQLYRLPWTTELGARQTKQAVFLDKRGVKIERIYSLYFDAYSFDESNENRPVLKLAFENRESSGLGEPLPEGVLRMFEPSPTGDLFSGEGNLNDTATAEPVEITLASAIDLEVEATVDADTKDNLLRDTRTLIARAQLRIDNAKGVPVTLEVRQPPGNEYLTNAKIAHASQRTQRKFGDYMWRVRVPANAAGTLDYEIRAVEPE